MPMNWRVPHLGMGAGEGRVSANVRVRAGVRVDEPARAAHRASARRMRVTARPLVARASDLALAAQVWPIGIPTVPVRLAPPNSSSYSSSSKPSYPQTF